MKPRKSKTDKAPSAKSAGRVRTKIVDQATSKLITPRRIHWTPDLVVDEIVEHVKCIASPATLAKRIQRKQAAQKKS